MQRNQLFTVGSQLTKESIVAGEWGVWEVDFEKFGVAAAVGGRVEDGVDVAEDGFGGRGLAEAIGDIVKGVRIEIGCTSGFYLLRESV